MPAGQVNQPPHPPPPPLLLAQGLDPPLPGSLIFPPQQGERGEMRDPGNPGNEVASLALFVLSRSRADILSVRQTDSSALALG